MMPHLYKNAGLDAAVNERNVLGVAVSRRLRETLLIAENAALGRFPCKDSIRGYEAQWDFPDQALLNRMGGWAC